MDIDTSNNRAAALTSRNHMNVSTASDKCWGEKAWVQGYITAWVTVRYLCSVHN